MIKLIAVDMDATFLTDEKTYDVATFKRVSRKMQEKGYAFVVASGNSINKLTIHFDEEDLKWIYITGDNGSMITQNGQTLHAHFIERSIVQHYVETVSKINGCYCLLTTQSGQSYRIDTKPMLSYVQEAFAKYNLYVNVVGSVLEVPLTETILKVVTYGDYTLQENKKMAQTLQTTFPMLSVVTSGEQWIDAINCHAGKGNAIAFLQRQLNVTKENSIAFGDSLNDLSMMQQVDYAVAMGNATDTDLIQACRYRIGTNNEQSVLAVVEEWLDGGDAIFENYKK